MRRWAIWGLLLVTLTLNLARCISIDADFPAGITRSRALYTDEGWYAMNAIAIARGESWYTPGELNSIVPLPVVPLLQAGVFRLFGPSLVAARALVAAAVVVLIACTASLALELSVVSAALVAAMLSADFVLFGYSRLAINDPVAAALATLALLVASRRWTRWGSVVAGVAGLLLAGALLAKTTAVCAVPALGYLYATQNAVARQRRYRAVVALGACALVGVGYHLWSFSLLPLDYAHFGAAAITRVATGPLTLARNFGVAVLNTLRVEPIVAPIALGGSVVLAVRSPAFLASRVVRAAALWILGFLVVVSASAYQPSRYFLLALPPLFLLFAAVLVHAGQAWPARRLIRIGPAVAACFFLALNAAQVAAYLMRPQYTFVAMTREVAAVVSRTSADGRPGVLMGDMAPSVDLATGVRGISLGEARWDLPTQAAAYCPTHYITLGSPGEQEFRAVSALYRVRALGSWDVFGNFYHRRAVRLYGLEPRGAQMARCLG